MSLRATLVEAVGSGHYTITVYPQDNRYGVWPMSMIVGLNDYPRPGVRFRYFGAMWELVEETGTLTWSVRPLEQ